MITDLSTWLTPPQTETKEMCIRDRRSTDVPVDAHLMVSNPDETVDWYADAGADMITVHLWAKVSIMNIMVSVAYIRLSE